MAYRATWGAPNGLLTPDGPVKAPSCLITATGSSSVESSSWANGASRGKSALHPRLETGGHSE
jgi:hypothetical protein